VAEARIRATRSERIMIVELSSRRAIDFSKSPTRCATPTTAAAPNARLCIRQGRVEFYALRDIAPGEEITVVNYGETHHEGRDGCAAKASAAAARRLLQGQLPGSGPRPCCWAAGHGVADQPRHP
jgi:uncharacterized protein